MLKSTAVIILAPVCCAAAMINSTEAALRQTAETFDSTESGEMLKQMCQHLRRALAELDSMRILYDKHLA